MPATTQSQPETAAVVEPKSSDVVQSVVLAVSAAAGTTRLKGQPAEHSVALLNLTHKGVGFRMVYPRRLAVELIVAVAGCLPESERQIAVARILEVGEESSASRRDATSSASRRDATEVGA